MELTKGVMYQAIRASISIPVSYTHLVELLPRQDAALRPYEKNIQKYIPMPAMAKKLHVENEQRMNALEEAANTLKTVSYTHLSAGITDAIFTNSFFRDYFFSFFTFFFSSFFTFWSFLSFFFAVAFFLLLQ